MFTLKRSCSASRARGLADEQRARADDRLERADFRVGLFDLGFAIVTFELEPRGLHGLIERRRLAFEDDAVVFLQHGVLGRRLLLAVAHHRIHGDVLAELLAQRAQRLAREARFGADAAFGHVVLDVDAFGERAFALAILRQQFVCEGEEHDAEERKGPGPRA